MPVTALAALVAATVVVALAGDDGGRGADQSRGEQVLGASSASDRAEAQAIQAPAAPSRTAIRRTLERAVAEATALGGTVEAAALHQSWATPAIATSDPGGERRRMRMWSMSKVATAVALLRALGWGDVRGEALSQEVRRAIRGALVRSENCRQRRVVLELQQRVGGTDAARRAVGAVVGAAAMEATVASEAEPPTALCIGFLTDRQGLADPLAPALLLGVSTWTVADAVRFMDALGEGAYGRAVARYLLERMRVPKRRSREVPAEDLTAALDWGAGRAFARLEPAYKAGWGGTLQGEFFAGQMALVEIPDAGSTAIAVAFHPDAQPARDDPGITAAPEGIELVMGALRRALARP